MVAIIYPSVVFLARTPYLQNLCIKLIDTLIDMMLCIGILLKETDSLLLEGLL